MLKIDSMLTGIDADAEFTMELATQISSLWRSDAIQSVYARKSEYWILDGAKYYFENAERIAEVRCCDSLHTKRRS
jgi:hypothetical protein